MQVFEPVSQVGFVPLQASPLVSVHSTQVFVAVLHAGFVGSWQFSSFRHSTHVLDESSQTLPSPQTAALSTVQATHEPLSSRQIGSAGSFAAQASSAAQGVQVWVEASQIGVPPAQSALVAHCTQFFVVGSQIIAPLWVQSSFESQPTHVFVVASQSGLSPLHEPMFSPSQAAQVPLARHTGFCGSFAAH